jgi:hypothetical protein
MSRIGNARAGGSGYHHALGTPISAATLTQIRATLRAALNVAVRRGLLTDNPIIQAELPRARRQRALVRSPYRVEQWRRSGERPAVAVWTAAQTAQFLCRIEDHPLYAAFHLIALRAVRRGEAAGLRRVREAIGPCRRRHRPPANKRPRIIGQEYEYRSAGCPSEEELPG